MNYYELTVTAKLNREVTNDEIYSLINNHINKSMLADEKLKEMHEKNQYKYYTFSSLWPIEKDKIYETDKIYIFNIRSIDQRFLMRLKRVINQTKDNILIISTELKTYHQIFISKLITLTPILVTMPDKKNWVSKYGVNELISRISKNSIRKYNQYYSMQIPEETEFITGIVQINSKPIKIPYKQTTLIGNKFQILVKEDKLSQDLSFFAKACGVGEKGSIRTRICNK